MQSICEKPTNFNPLSAQAERQRHDCQRFTDCRFQSTLRASRETCKRVTIIDIIDDFNPLSAQAERRREWNNIPTSISFQSTLRASRETVLKQSLDAKDVISIHSPRKQRDQIFQRCRLVTIYFNPLSAQAERPTEQSSRGFPKNFNPLSAQAERLADQLGVRRSYGISIHSPRKQRDIMSCPIQAARQDFNPLSAQAERPCPPRQLASYFFISIHSPRKQRDIKMTLPVWRINNFNPLSAQAERQQICTTIAIIPCIRIMHFKQII